MINKLREKSGNTTLHNSHKQHKISWDNSNETNERMNEKNFKSLKKETLPCSCIGRNNIVKMAILPKAVYKLQI